MEENKEGFSCPIRPKIEWNKKPKILTKEEMEFNSTRIEYVKWLQEHYPDGYGIANFKGLTGNQSHFLDFLLQNKEIVASIGDMEFVFETVRKFLRN